MDFLNCHRCREIGLRAHALAYFLENHSSHDVEGVAGSDPWCRNEMIILKEVKTQQKFFLVIDSKKKKRKENSSIGSERLREHLNPRCRDSSDCV